MNKDYEGNELTTGEGQHEPLFQALESSSENTVVSAPVIDEEGTSQLSEVRDTVQVGEGNLNSEEAQPQFTPSNVVEESSVLIQPAGQSQTQHKTKLWLIIGISSLILALLLGMYGVGLYNKTQKINELKDEQSKLVASKSEVEQIVQKDGTLLNLQTFAACYQQAEGLNGGSAFRVLKLDALISVSEITANNVKEQLSECKKKSGDTPFEGADQLVEETSQAIVDANKQNAQYTAEAKQVASDWIKFAEALPKSGSGMLDSGTYNTLRNLAATAMGVGPETIGNEINVETVMTKVQERLKAIGGKQTLVSADKINQFIQEKGANRSSAEIESEYDVKANELKQVENELSDLDTHIQTKRSELWNPFK